MKKKQLLTAKTLLDVLRSWVGYSIYNEGHDKILHIYNSQKKLPRGYKVKSTDQWCATGLSSAIITANMQDLIGTECSCQRFVEIFKNKDIWEEDGSILPEAGYIIVYNWDDKTQPNDGWADHIGIVERVTDTTIVTIECNYRQGVNRRYVPIGAGYIRGYAIPNYENELVDEQESNEKIAEQVIQGKWGNGYERMRRLNDAGYDYYEIQLIVNSRLATKAK